MGLFLTVLEAVRSVVRFEDISCCLLTWRGQRRKHVLACLSFKRVINPIRRASSSQATSDSHLLPNPLLEGHRFQLVQ